MWKHEYLKCIFPFNRNPIGIKGEDGLEKQFAGLVLALSEKGLVAGFCLCQTSSLKDVSSMLKDINQHEGKITTVYSGMLQLSTNINIYEVVSVCVSHVLN